MNDLGCCQSGYCDRPAVVYVAGPTLGRSPRVTVIGGDRAVALSELEFGVLNPRCLECAINAVEDVAATMAANERNAR